MKVGAERKKVIILIVLLAVAAVLLYQQFVSGPTAPSAAPPPSRSTNPSAPAAQLRSTADEILGGDSRAASKTRAASRTNNTFKPSLKKRKPGDGPAVDQMDPTLRTDLLAKVQAVEYQGAERNLFQFGKPKLTPQQIEKAKGEAEEAQKKIAEAAKTPPPAPPKPTAPPVNFKYFGWVHEPGDARKRALLLDGEDILVAAEGEVIKKRYKVVRIGINSLVVEDLDFKSQQTLPLQESSPA